MDGPLLLLGTIEVSSGRCWVEVFSAVLLCLFGVLWDFACVGSYFDLCSRSLFLLSLFLMFFACGVLRFWGVRIQSGRPVIDGPALQTALLFVGFGIRVYGLPKP